MTDEEAYRVLGVPMGATMAQIKTAYYAGAKRHHPDRNPGAETTAAFQQVQEAYRTLIGHDPSHIVVAGRPRRGDGASGPGPNAMDGTEAPDPVAVVRAFMARADLCILFDGSIVARTQPRMGYGPNDVEAWLTRAPVWSVEQLLDEVMLDVRRGGISLSAGDIGRAVRKIVREDQRHRADFIMRPLVFARLDAAEKVEAQTGWERLVGAVFDREIALGVAVLQHFVWQVKRKQLERPVHHHLMPVIVSRVQGTGKTTFVRRFLSPLQELATDPVLLSDLADRRSGDVYRFPVAFVDDVERLDPRHIATLKSILSTGALNRRRLGTSMTDKRRQLATVIGTANEPVGVLIADPTGLRRFAELPFRNGAVAKGGDETVWRAVDEADYSLLWRSIDGFGPAPIEPYLAALTAAQDAAAPADRLRECLVRLDVHSEAVQNISVRGGVRADELRLLLCALTGEHIPRNRFDERMAALVGDPAVPLKPKVRMALGCVYPLKHPGPRTGMATPT